MTDRKIVVYRCGWCGSPVSPNGDILEKWDRELQIGFLREGVGKNWVLAEIKVNGECCPNGDNDERGKI